MIDGLIFHWDSNPLFKHFIPLNLNSSIQTPPTQYSNQKKQLKTHITRI
jgi:hypothetical protein